MSFESLTIPLETEKKNMSPIEVPTVDKCKEALEETYGPFFASSLDGDQKIIFDYKSHPVFQGYLDAYKNHRPITISPDIIWLLIVQAFSNYVAKNAEELRPMFVNFDGKKEITVKRLDLNFFRMTKEDWMANIFPEIVEQISDFTGKNVTDMLTPNFTTTTQISLSVGQMSIMSAFKHYFSFKVMLGGCGLPYVTIEGSIEDWEKINQKLDSLNKYKFDFYTKRVKPIIEKIIDTKRGKVDKEFWLKMIKIKDSNGFYDPGYVDGWFTNFFPYDDSGEYIEGPIFENVKLSNEVLSVPFELIIVWPNQTEEHVNSEFLAGFIGMKQEANMSMKPEIGWFVRKEMPKFRGIPCKW